MAYSCDINPTLWLEQQLAFDIYGSKGCLPVKHPNLLVSAEQLVDEQFLDVVMYIPRGMSLCRVSNDCLEMDSEMVLDKATLLWDAKGSLPKTPQFWILNAVDEFSTSKVDFQMCEESVILPFPEQQFEEVRIVEFFSGGYGGWHAATKHLSFCTSAPIKVVGIENDLTACRNYAISHQVPVFSAKQTLPHDLLHSCQSSCVIHADVFSKRWLPPITMWRPHVACISAPCQPWSEAGATKGLMAFDGLAFTEVLGHCRFFKPLFLLIEQVEGFIRHPHKQMIIKTCLASGFVHVWSRVIDIHAHCPTHRPRWIAMFRHVDCPLRFSSHFQMPTVKTHPSPEQFDAVLPFDLAFDARLFPSSQALEILSDPSLLPDHKRLRVRSNAMRSEVLSLRCGLPQDVTPTFMASYGHQHRLSTNHLKSKGCLTHLLQPSIGPPRHWHPIEILILHLGLEAFFVDPDWELAYKFLGNQISLAHAIPALVNVFNQLPFFDFNMNLDQVFQKALERRITVANMIQLPLAGGILVAHQDVDLTKFSGQVEKFIDEMIAHDLQPFPDDSFWYFMGFHLLGELKQDSTPSPISPTDVVEPERSVSPTKAFIPVLPISIKGKYGDHQFWTFADVTPNDLVGLWEGYFEIVCSETGFQLVPSKAVTVVPQKNLLVSMKDGRVTISNANEDGFQLSQLGLDHDFVFDQFGLVTEKMHSFAAEFLSNMPLRAPSTRICTESILQAMDRCQIQTAYQPSTDTIVFEFQGDPDACQHIRELFVKGFAPQTLQALGRVCHSDGKKIWYEPSHSSDAAPPAAFRIAAVVSMARLLLDSQRDESGRPVTFKWLKRVLWDGPIHSHTAIDGLRKLVSLAFFWIDQGDAISFVHRGKNIWNYKVLDLDDRHTKGCQIHIVRPFHGGGSKLQHRVQVKNSLAGTLLEEGVELQWITTHVEKVVDTLGVNKLLPIASLPAGQDRVRQIRELFTNAGFPFPTIQKKSVQAPKTLQAKARKQMPAGPSPSDVVIDCSYLLNEDDSHPKQIHEFRGQRSGVFLATMSDAIPWLKEGQPLSADELGMIVMGDSQVNTSLPQKAILLPCEDCQGNHFLLSATLVQFGSKAIKIKPLDDQKISGGECKVSAVTLWKQDWSLEEWNAAVSQTVQFVKEAFAFDLPDVIVSCWGRSLRKGRQVATNAEATSIQLHCSVVADHFNSFLAKSGFNRLWTTPKKQDGRISDDYRILWVPGELQHVTAIAAGLSGCAGLVRGKTSLGLRFAMASFEAAWKHVHPKETVPEHIPATFVFKVEPLPFGCSPQQLEDWAKHVNWKCRPLRATGPCAWLVCAAAMPPSTTLAFNGSPLLVRLLPPRNSPTVRTIVAGPRYVAKASSETASVPSNLAFDPWAQWKGPRVAPNVPQAMPKAGSGPTDQKIQQQDDRIAALEGQIQNLQVGQSKQQQQIEQIGQEVQQSEQRLATQVHKVVDDAKNDITKSLQATLQQQQSQFENSMKDIRQLLTAAAKRKHSDGPDDMES